jgi:hypothetical protein
MVLHMESFSIRRDSARLEARIALADVNVGPPRIVLDFPPAGWPRINIKRLSSCAAGKYAVAADP